MFFFKLRVLVLFCFVVVLCFVVKQIIREWVTHHTACLAAGTSNFSNPHELRIFYWETNKIYISNFNQQIFIYGWLLACLELCMYLYCAFHYYNVFGIYGHEGRNITLTTPLCSVFIKFTNEMSFTDWVVEFVGICFWVWVALHYRSKNPKSSSS